MKKLIATAAASVLALATISAGDGLKVSGFIRGGLSTSLTDGVADAKHIKAGDTVIGKSWVNGKKWGGTSRARFNTSYDGDNGGVTFRFQSDLIADNYFVNDSVKWAMAYAKFIDGMVMVEGGKLVDDYTGADDDNGATFDGDMGLRLLVNPIEGLYIGFQGSAFNPKYYHYDSEYVTEGSNEYDAKKARRQNNPKFDQNLFALTARYENDTLAVAAGAHFSGVFYGSFLYKGIEGLKLVAGFQAEYAGNWDSENNVWTDADKSSKNVLLDATVEYNADPVLFGVVTYFYVADDEWFAANGKGWASKVYPYVQYKLSDITALRAEAALYIPHGYENSNLDKDMYATITPSVVFNASKKADVNVWLTISTDTEVEQHATGVGVRYNF